MQGSRMRINYSEHPHISLVPFLSLVALLHTSSPYEPMEKYQWAWPRSAIDRYHSSSVFACFPFLIDIQGEDILAT